MLFLVILAGVYFHLKWEEKKKIKELQDKLSLAEETYESLVQHSKQCIFLYNGTTQIVEFMNERYKELGIPGPWMRLSQILTLLEKRNLTTCQRVRRIAESVWEYTPEVERELFVNIRGKNHFLKLKMVNLFDKNQLVSRSIGMIEDVTEQKENAMMMRREREFRKSLLVDCLGYMEVDVRRDMVLENSFSSVEQKEQKGSFSQLIDFYAEKKVLSLYQDEVRQKMSKKYMLQLVKEEIFELYLEYETMEADQSVLWTACDIHINHSEEKEELISYLVFRNIDKKKKEQIKLEQEARIDTLTGALKRKIAQEKIDQIMQNPLPPGYCHVFMILDLDNFKTLNDTFGHMCGDMALKDFVKTAQSNCRKQDIVCRLGGDEFILFLNEVPRSAVEHKAQELLDVLQATYEREQVSVTVGASMGMALVPDHGSCFEELYEIADVALYRVKTGKKGTYQIAGDKEEV